MHIHTSKLIAFVVGISVCLLISACEKISLNKQMEELCKKDGRLTVYEHVALPKSMYNQNNNVVQRAETVNGQTQTIVAETFVLQSELSVLKDGNLSKGEGRLIRMRTTVVRPSDGKLLGELIEYVRSGGDGPIHLGHHTTTICPSVAGGLVPQVFFKLED